MDWLRRSIFSSYKKLIWKLCLSLMELALISNLKVLVYHHLHIPVYLKAFLRWNINRVFFSISPKLLLSQRSRAFNSILGRLHHSLITFCYQSFVQPDFQSHIRAKAFPTYCSVCGRNDMKGVEQNIFFNLSSSFILEWTSTNYPLGHALPHWVSPSDEGNKHLLLE